MARQISGGMSSGMKVGMGLIIATILIAVIVGIWYVTSTPSSEITPPDVTSEAEDSGITGATPRSGPGGDCPCKDGSYCNEADRKCYEKCNPHGDCSVEEIPHNESYECNYITECETRHCQTITDNYGGAGTRVCCPLGDTSVGDGSACSSGCALYGNPTRPACPGIPADAQIPKLETFTYGLRTNPDMMVIAKGTTVPTGTNLAGRFKAYPSEAPGTKRFCWGNYPGTNPERSMIETGNCGDWGWTHGGEFWAYNSQQPGTIRKCWGTATNPDRIYIEGTTSCGDYGWTHGGEIWVYPA